MKSTRFMQIYCAALTGLIAAQGRNDLLTESRRIKSYHKDAQMPLADRAARLRAEHNQFEFIDGLTEVAELIANSAMLTLEGE
jgi:hypothetical protein